jgi:GAF domain-containing protein
MSDMTGEKKGQRSDHPLAELKKERDSFVQTFFKKGAQFTQELVNENARLRGRVGEIEHEVLQLRAQVASDDAIRELLRKIELLERDKTKLLSRYEQAEAASSRWVDQYTEVESELANFANLYVASVQLHASLSFRSTVRQIKELLEQLMGASAFAVYLTRSDGRKLSPIASQGVPKPHSVAINPGDGGIAEVFATGVERIDRGDLSHGSPERPIALVPMKMEDKVVGVLVVYATLEQKTRFAPVDFELFKLLGAHAAEALVCARLYADAQHQLPSFDSYFDSEI